MTLDDRNYGWEAVADLSVALAILDKIHTRREAIGLTSGQDDALGMCREQINLVKAEIEIRLKQ
jgi:hypothetical protein